MSQRCLVLVPALASDERLWRPVTEHFDDRIEWIVADNVGDSVESIADQVLQQAPERFHLAGLSMGGYVALEVALRRTGRLVSLALLNTSARGAPPEREASARELIEMAGSGRFSDVVERLSSMVAPVDPMVAAVAAAMARDGGPAAFQAQQDALLARRDRRSELAGIDVPTLVVGGRMDTITPLELSQELADAIPDAELVTIEAVGHLSSLEQPDTVAALLQQWVERHDGH